MPSEPTAEGDLLEVAGISAEQGISQGEDPYAAAADSWAAGQPISLSEDDDESAARRLYDLALEFQERSQRSEARLLDEFEGASSGLVSVIGDLNSRRGQIMGTSTRGNAQIVNAMVPLANMFGYINNLRSMSQGRASYTMQFDHYEQVPTAVAEEVKKKYS